jgi:L-ascorbate metabolism protein UlaG (beta-lactamase superfamily)
VDSTVRFRWLGAAGIELVAGGEVLLIDPFVTRPPWSQLLVGRVAPDEELIARVIEQSDYILVSHAHYDHLLDVPEIARRTGARVYGSPNTCGIAAACQVPASQIGEVTSGQVLSLGPFAVEVLEAEHVKTPADRVLNGPLAPDLSPPLRLRDYRMDHCFRFRIHVDDVRVLHSPGRAEPADLLCVGTHAPDSVYQASLPTAHPKAVVPIHWDNFFRPLSRPICELRKPGGRRLDEFLALVERLAPQANLLVPKALQARDLAPLL